jgi:hypothetical protein
MVRLRTWARRLLPWLVAASVLAALLVRYRLADIVEQVRRGHALAMVPMALLMPIALLLVYATCDRIVLLACVRRLRYGEIVRGKAGSAVLMALGYLFGSGGYGVWIARRAGLRPSRAAGVLLYIMASDMTSVAIVAATSLWLHHLPVPAGLRAVSTGIAISQVVLILVGPLNLLRRPLPAVFAPWQKVPPHWGLAQLAGRCLSMLIAISATFTAARAFGMPLPLGAVAAWLPVILLVASLPVNIAGLGAVQLVWLAAFTPWAPPTQVLAFQFLWQLMTGAAIVLRGLPFVRRVIVEIDEGSPIGVESPAADPTSGKVSVEAGGENDERAVAQ